ncbi:ABC transporter permease [Corynebacterium uropygiale]|uniref:ABC transporter permease n=1 Tax=Corynebacterium uropygiale TaxID=1775911 RepID=A0A9X1QMQ0_9CORY|nr:ABC transporter permease [Corynebacterium uropygiale]MCF4006162.1 ABC transporter permease [Corynebacterium uropygiale]
MRILRPLLHICARLVAGLIAASIIIFIALRIIPGNPAAISLGVSATPEAVAKLSHELGTDRPLLTQFADWFLGMLRGDFGVSLSSKHDIGPMIADRAQVSAIMCGCAMILSLLIAIPVGMWAARRQHHVDGLLVSAASQVGMAIPNFLAALLLVAILALHWRLLPAMGWVVPGDRPGAFLAHLVLPVVSLTLVQSAILARYIRSAILDVIAEDHIRTARMTGLSLGAALRRHGLRHAALPVLTVAGVQLTSLVIGAVVIERVFMVPGLGSLLVDAVSTRDLPLVQAVVMCLVAFTLIVNFLVDATATLIDPRVRSELS